MDQFEGYSDFSRFLKKHSIPFSLNLSDFTCETELRGNFSSYEKYMSLALTRSSAAEYQSLVTFFSSFPSIFSPLYVFLSNLCKKDMYSATPSLDTLYFTSSEEADLNSTPFSSPPRPEILHYKQKRVLLHKLTAGTLTLAGIVYLFTQLVLERKEFTAAEKLISNLEVYQELYYKSDANVDAL
ncbi:MAG: hypothetical protein ACI8RA_002426 [Chlamydiales bacterium]|jgi:hypothetical protein